MTKDEIIELLKAFMLREVLEGADVGLDAKTQLLELGLLNSMSVLMLLGEIEKKLDVVVPRDQIKPENLKDLDTIADLVLRIGT
jgi:acyl carrier protein